MKGHLIVDKRVHRGFPDAGVGRGNRAVESQSLSQIDPCPDIVTFHFPIRPVAQFRQKVKNVILGRMKSNPMGARYGSWYSVLEEGKLGEVFSEYQLNPEQHNEKLGSGEVIEDRRPLQIVSVP